MNDNSEPAIFYGTKKLKATLMSREEYCSYRGWDVPDNEDGDDLGYLVEYLDGGAPNDDRHAGYISWSPQGVFEAAYQPITSMSFGHALQALKEGHKVARAGWNGKGMFIVLMPALYLPPFNTQDTNKKVNDRTAKWIGEDKPLDCQPYLAMYTADEKWVPGWLASQTDMLSDDWQIVN